MLGRSTIETFSYLGSGVGTTGGTEVGIKASIGKARGDFVMLNKIWKDRTISLKTKLRIFNSIVSLCSTMIVKCGKQK